MTDIFESENEFEANTQSLELEKALNAGYGTDAAGYTGGRSLQREDLEATLVSILDVKQKDCKVFHKLHKQPVSSTVHQVERRTGVGEDEFLFVGEGEQATEGNQDLSRKIYETKYLSSKWQVSHPMTLTNNVDNAINSEKVAATLRISKACEGAIFHGDSSVNPKAFDGFIKVLRDSANDTSKPERFRATRMDLRGLEIGETGTIDDVTIDAGEALFDEVSEKVFSKGGDLEEAYFSPVVAKQFKQMYSDRLRFTTQQSEFTMEKLPNIITSTNQTIKIRDDAGADKMFRVKGKIVAAGNPEKRPNPPTSVTAVASNEAGAFTTSYAGDYMYAVHAVNAYGISAGTAIGSAVTVADGKKVTLTIEPSSSGAAATGFIITRSKAGGTELMEMVRIAKGSGDTTTYVDKNKDLPGTTSIVLIAPDTDEMVPNVSFGQLMGLSNFDLPTDSSLAHRGVVALYGMLEVRAPEYCAIIDNVGYAGGLY